MEEIINFSEWYHYIFIVLWMVVLFLGLKYFYKIEKLFKLKDDFRSGNKVVVGLLITSFIFGFFIYLIWVLAPEFGQSKTATIVVNSLIVFTFMMNAFVCFKNYKIISAFLRFLLISVLMLVYFYSAWLSGLLLIGVFSLVVIFYTLRWLKRTFI